MAGSDRDRHLEVLKTCTCRKLQERGTVSAFFERLWGFLCDPERSSALTFCGDGWIKTYMSMVVPYKWYLTFQSSTSDRSTDPPTPRRLYDKMERLTALLLLALIGSGIDVINSKPCTTKELSVFNVVSDQVNKCLKDSKLNFQLPPRSSLSKTQQSALCKSKPCQEMIGSVDDLDIPVCESAVNEKNMTLQMSLDTFVSSCDTTTPAPSPIKRRKSLEKSSGSSDSFYKKRERTNLATAVQFGTLQQVVVLLTMGILSVGLVLQ